MIHDFDIELIDNIAKDTILVYRKNIRSTPQRASEFGFDELLSGCFKFLFMTNYVQCA